MAEMNKVDESQRLDTLDARGTWVYPSAAESGHVEIELPSLPGSPNPTERLHARDFGAHLIGKIESRFAQNPYLRSGPQQSPSLIFRHYIGAGKGCGLLSDAVSSRMESLAKQFEEEPEQREFFEQVLRPCLLSLSPKRRQK